MQHKQSKPRWSRKRKVITGALSLLVIPAVAIGAALFFTARIDGGISVPTSPEVRFATNIAGLNKVIDSEGVITCATPVVSGNVLTLDISSAWPGSSCTYQVKLYTTGSTEAVKVQDVLINGVTDLEVLSGCGATVSQSVSTATTVDFRVTIQDDAEPGEHPYDSEAGVQTVLSPEYDPLLCPTAS